MPSPDPLATQFPYPQESDRLLRYQVNAQLLEGDHYGAFNMSAQKDFTDAYNRLRYVVANFVGLVSKVSADTLFGEPIILRAGKNQEAIDYFWHKQNMQTQLFESSLSNAALGDAVLKVRVKDRNVIIEDITPSIYFPHTVLGNPRATPTADELAWVETQGDKAFVIREVHTAGFVYTQIHELTKKGGKLVEGGKLVGPFEIGPAMDVAAYNAIAGTNYQAEVATKIDESLIIHIPNFRLFGHSEFFGVSDFYDLKTLQFGLNNRITKIDNVLDKHSDPILAVPPGVLDEEGNVKREALNMFEVGPEASGAKPEYIVWNANLESAWKEIDKLVEFLFMFSETSPDVLGMGEGKAESGRALKLRMLRTLAKRNRKRNYYDNAIKDALAIAQKLCVANGYTLNGMKVTGVEDVQISWPDGVVDDVVEMNEMNISQVESGIRSKITAIMEMQNLPEEEAIKELERINKEAGDFESIMDVGREIPNQNAENID